MNNCRDCKHGESKNKPWYSTQPHPCIGCVNQSRQTDNFEPIIVSDPRFTQEMSQYWIDEYDRAEGDWFSPNEFIESLRRRNTDEVVCEFALKAIKSRPRKS